MIENLDLALKVYAEAKAFVRAAGYSWEIEWQRSRTFCNFSETDLLRETAWVILCSGFREFIVRKAFDHVSLCFCDWESAQAIVAHAETCRATCLVSFRNVRKIDAIIDVARHIDRRGYDNVRNQILDDPIGELRCFPYVGPVTSHHLAKNLGLQVAKPDRHLVRLSSLTGFTDAQHLCEAVSHATGEAVNVIDVVLWRYAATAPNLISWRAKGDFGYRSRTPTRDGP